MFFFISFIVLSFGLYTQVFKSSNTFCVCFCSLALKTKNNVTSDIDQSCLNHPLTYSHMLKMYVVHIFLYIICRNTNGQQSDHLSNCICLEQIL